MKQFVCTQLCLPFASLRYIISRQVLPLWSYKLENILALPNMNTELVYVICFTYYMMDRMEVLSLGYKLN